MPGESNMKKYRNLQAKAFLALKEAVKEVRKESSRVYGFRPMPVFIKVLFIILIIGLFSSLFYISGISKAGYPVFGLNITGISALLIFIFLNFVVSIVFLIGMWKRYKWTKAFGIIYFLFFIINGLVSLTTLRQRVVLIKQQFPFDVSGLDNIIYTSTLIGILIGVLINIIFLVLFYFNRKYFD